MPYKDPEKDKEYHKEWYRKHREKELLRLRNRWKNLSVKEKKEKITRDYIARRERRGKLRIILIFLFGAQCLFCGYDKNFSALDFAHISEKTGTYRRFAWGTEFTQWVKTGKLPDNVILLCANCHRETHNTDFQLP